MSKVLNFWNLIHQKIMPKESTLPMLYGHVVARLQDSIVVFGGKIYNAAPGETFGKVVRQSPHVIWTYNIYTDQWKQHAIIESKVPPNVCFGVTIKMNIYALAYAFRNDNLATVWKLQKDKNNEFSWSTVLVNKAPSSRFCMTGWEYAEKM